MDPVSAAASPLIPVIGGSVVLLVVHILMQGVLATKELGSTWNAGPRDEEKKPAGRYAGRAERASANFRETYPGFLALALALLVIGETGALGVMGAWTWLVARVVYVPLYLAGVPYIRSLVWVISLIGLAMMLVALLS